MKKVLIILATMILILGAQTTSSKLQTEITVLKPGDKIHISYIDVDAGGNPTEKIAYKVIRADGTIFHELLGNIKLNGLTLEEAEDLLQDNLSKYFTNPRVSVSVVEKSLNHVLLYGEVPRIGVYPAEPGIKVAEFIVETGGTSPNADITKIAVTRKSGLTILFNLENYLYSNIENNNVVLQDGDKVVVPRITDKQIFNRLSREYILTYGNVVSISINETSRLETAPAEPELYTVDPEGNIYHKLFGTLHIGGLTVDKVQATLEELARNYYQKPVVSLEVVQLTTRSVFIFGEVNRPGIYPLEGNIRLAEFLANIGGVTSKADLNEIIITRANGTRIVFDLQKFLYNRRDNNNIYLEDGDRIIVQSRQRGFSYRLEEIFYPYRSILQVISTGLLIYITLKG